MRLPADLDARLGTEAARQGKSRSEVAREAIAEYLARRERERFLAALVGEARTAYAEAGLRAEALGIAEVLLALDHEGLDLTEGRQSDEPWPADLGEKWWK